jgi:hypothetical protein
VLPDKDAAQSGEVRVVDENGADLFFADCFVAINVPARVKASLLKASWHRLHNAEAPPIAFELGFDALGDLNGYAMPAPGFRPGRRSRSSSINIIEYDNLTVGGPWLFEST